MTLQEISMSRHHANEDIEQPSRPERRPSQRRHLQQPTSHDRASMPDAYLFLILILVGTVFQALANALNVLACAFHGVTAGGHERDCQQGRHEFEIHDHLRLKRMKTQKRRQCCPSGKEPQMAPAVAALGCPNYICVVLFSQSDHFSKSDQANAVFLMDYVLSLKAIIVTSSAVHAAHQTTAVVLSVMGTLAGILNMTASKEARSQWSGQIDSGEPQGATTGTITERTQCAFQPSLCVETTVTVDHQHVSQPASRSCVGQALQRALILVAG
jgi:hypothetical protein